MSTDPNNTQGLNPIVKKAPLKQNAKKRERKPRETSKKASRLQVVNQGKTSDNKPFVLNSDEPHNLKRSRHSLKETDSQNV